MQIIKHITALKEQIHVMQDVKLSAPLTIQLLQSSATANNNLQKLIKLSVPWSMTSTKAPNKTPANTLMQKSFAAQIILTPTKYKELHIVIPYLPTQLTHS